MNFELALIRVVHILVGVIWAGSAIFLAGFLDPRLRALGPDVHRRVLAALYLPLRFVLEGGGAITILVGIALVFRLQRIDDLLDTNWGWAITIGLITSVIAHTTGVLALTSLKKLSGADEGEADRLTDRATTLARMTAVMVTVAVVTMAAARFVG